LLEHTLHMLVEQLWVVDRGDLVLEHAMHVATMVEAGMVPCVEHGLHEWAALSMD
jgi:hypothetical protein